MHLPIQNNKCASRLVNRKNIFVRHSDFNSDNDLSKILFNSLDSNSGASPGILLTGFLFKNLNRKNIDAGCVCLYPLLTPQSRYQSSLGQHWAHLGHIGPRWAPCWPQKACCQGIFSRLLLNHFSHDPTQHAQGPFYKMFNWDQDMDK